jgi:hypothetical protein
VKRFKCVSWDYRPAIFFEKSEDGAFAVTRPGGVWKEVDWSDVVDSGRLMPQEEWRAMFEEKYGPLDLSKIPKPSE